MLFSLFRVSFHSSFTLTNHGPHSASFLFDPLSAVGQHRLTEIGFSTDIQSVTVSLFFFFFFFFVYSFFNSLLMRCSKFFLYFQILFRCCFLFHFRLIVLFFLFWANNNDEIYSNGIVTLIIPDFGLNTWALICLLQSFIFLHFPLHSIPISSGQLLHFIVAH